MTVPKTKRPTLRSRALTFLVKKRVFVVSAGIVLALGTAVTVQAFYYQDRVLPRTTVSGLEIGGMHRDEALKAVRQKVDAFQKRTLSYTYETREWKVANAELGLETDYETVVDRVYQEDKQGSMLRRLAVQFRTLMNPRDVDVAVKPLSKDAQKTLQEKIVASIVTPYTETDLSFANGKVSVVPGKAGTALDEPALYTGLSGSLNQGTERIALVLKQVQPQLSTEQVEPSRAQAESLLAETWNLQLLDKTVQLTPKEIAAWLDTEVKAKSDGVAAGLSLVLKPNAVEKYVKGIASKLDVKPVNATLAPADSGLQLVQDGKDGFAVAQDKTVTAIQNALLANQPVATRTIPGVAEIAKPDLRSETLPSLGLVEKIGTAMTDYTGSPANRIHNIETGTKALSTQFVRVGGTFTTTGTLGQVDEAHGYLPELVIKGNRTTPEYGGGLCQVSTTLFRAVLNAGLPIVERSNHSYRVGYYERGVGPGLDATVYIPNPDFKWKNDTGHGVYVIGYIKDKTVTFDLYGTKDGRVSSISKPTILSETPSGSPIYSYTDTMYKDQRKQLETAHPGAKTLVTYTVSRGGAEIYRKEFYSTYKPWPAQYLVGTKERPAAPAEATPAATPAEAVPTTAPEVPTPAP